MKTRVACDFIELNESILALPGGRAQIKPGGGTWYLFGRNNRKHVSSPAYIACLT